MLKNGTFIKFLSVVSVGILASSAHAQLTTFAQFTQVGSGKPFTFTNTGSTSTFSLITPLNVNFYYQGVNGYNGLSFSNVIPATMTMTGTVASTAVNSFGQLFQQMTDITITFTATSPSVGSGNLLTIMASAGSTNRTGGILLGTGGGSTVGFTGSENDNTGIGDAVTMTSEYLDFSTTSQRDYNISLNAVTPSYAIDGNNYIRSFTADGSGTFATNPAPYIVIPEPATLALFLPGLFLLRRRRK